MLEFRKVPDNDYFALKGVNASLIKDLALNPALAVYNFKNGVKKDSKSMRLGSLLHCLVLEPKTFSDRYLVVDTTTAVTKIYKDTVKENPDKIVLTKTEMEAARECYDANHEELIGLFVRTKNEQSIVGHIDVDGVAVPVKAKLDAIGDSAVYDLKTTSDAEWFHKDCFKYGYHLQAAFYTMLAEKIKGMQLDYYIVALETKPPFGLRYIKIERELITGSKLLVKNTIKKFFIENGKFYGSEIINGYKRPSPKVEILTSSGDCFDGERYQQQQYKGESCYGI